MQLIEDIASIFAHGSLAEMELSSDLTVGIAASDKP
jgi:hypothetical protein